VTADDRVTIRSLGPTDAALFDRVAAGVFDHAVEPRLAAEFLADPRHHMVVAMRDGVIVGMASALHYVHPDKPTELWINEVGVAPTEQRRGIGRRILAALLAEGRALGCTEAWLGTDESNTAARSLYAALGGREEPLVYVTFELGAAALDA
jgi:ribosomal protein S18 acetylase RimI-like enzyme